MNNFRIVIISLKRRPNNFGNSLRVWELGWDLDKQKVQLCYNWRVCLVSHRVELHCWPWFLVWRQAGSCQSNAQWPLASCGSDEQRQTWCKPNTELPLVLLQLDLLLYMLFCRTNTHSSTSKSRELLPAIPDLNLLNKETYLPCYMYIRRTENMYLLLYMLICSLISSL